MQVLSGVEGSETLHCLPQLTVLYIITLQAERLWVIFGFIGYDDVVQQLEYKRRKDCKNQISMNTMAKI